MSILRHSERLGNFGISLHSRIIESLVTRIEDAIAEGLIRCSQPTEHRPQLFSVFDFINVILGKKNPRDTWQTLTQADPHVVGFSDNVRFTRSDGRLNRKSPASDLVGLLYIAYMANSTFSVKLRVSSAASFAADRRPVVAPVQVVAVVPDAILAKCEDSQFNRTLTELHEISGIKLHKTVLAAVKRDFELGIDYVEAEGELLLTDDCFYWLVASLRSARGTDTAKLPENIPLTRRGFRLAVNHKNARVGCALDNSVAEVRPQIIRRFHNVSPVSLANLIPLQPKYGAGVETKPIRVPVFLVDEIRAFIAARLAQEP